MTTGKRHNPKCEPVTTAAIIPARGGKQSTPYKNLQKLGGKTLLAWAIEVAFAANSVDAVIVSTEDAKIAREAERHGAIVAPRPKKYSTPTVGDGGWYHHAVMWMEAKLGWKPELLVNLRPTGPLRFSDDVDNMVRYMKRTGADGLKSVIVAPMHPYKMWQFVGKVNLQPGKAAQLKPVFDNDYRRQRGPDQPRQQVQKKFPVFFQDAQIDITRRKFVLRSECLEYDNPWGPNIHGYMLDERSVVDIDTPEDLRQAAKMYRKLSLEKKR